MAIEGVHLHGRVHLVKRCVMEHVVHLLLLLLLLVLASLLVHVVVIGGDCDLVGSVGLLLTTVVAGLEVSKEEVKQS